MKKNDFFSNIISENKSNQRVLFSGLDVAGGDNGCDIFKMFFIVSWWIINGLFSHDIIVIL